MDIEDRWQQISQFLGKYQSMWQEEVLHLYPHYKGTSYPVQWIHYLKKLPFHDLMRLGCQGFEENIDLGDEEMTQFFARSQELGVIPAYEQLAKATQHKIPFTGIKGKKEHELKIILQQIQDWPHHTIIEKFLDFCGGMGHLSQNLTYRFPTATAECWDFDNNLQQMGKDRYGWRKLPVTYQQIDLLQSLEQLPPLTTCHTFALGLHTCGPLSVQQLKYSVHHQVTGLMSFGCCYNKLHAHHDYNLSAKAQHEGLELSMPALTMAERCYKKLRPQDFDFKIQVKKLRYAFFIFCYHYYPEWRFHSLGNSPKRLYATGNFALYAQEQMQRIQLPLAEQEKWTTDRLNQFFAASWVQEAAEEMILCGIIRAQLGRLVELYVLLDRCLYLQESGHQVQLREYFDRSLSPRNIGIFATLLDF